MNNILQENGEIDLLCNNEKRFISLDAMEEWQAEEITTYEKNDLSQISENCLKLIDEIPEKWFKNLTFTQLERIRKQKSLHEIQIPIAWIKFWRYVIKTPSLRRTDLISCQDEKFYTYKYLWIKWVSSCINKYLNDMEKYLLELLDGGLPHQYVGAILLEKYGDEFWKIPKSPTQNLTAPAQMVNTYIHSKLPTKLAKKDLYDFVLNHFNANRH